MQRTCWVGSPVAQASFWLMIVSMTIAVLPVWRSPMTSWRWPRPIGVMASMALMPVCIGSGPHCPCPTLGARRPLHHRGGLQLEGAATGGLDRAGTVDRVAQRVDDATEVAVADRHREDLAGPTDLLAFLDAGVVAEDDDTDLTGVQVQGQS